MALSKEYFANKLEQNKIKLAVHEAIPPDVEYTNLIIAFTEMLLTFQREAFKEDNKGGSK